MKAAFIIIIAFVVAMFVFAIALNFGTFFTSVRGGTTSIILSADGGETWFGLAQQDGQKELERASILTLKYNPSDARVVYAGTNGRGLYKSTDGGASWVKLVDKNNILSPGARVYDVSFGPTYVDVNAGRIEVVYVAVSQNNFGHILVSSDGGFTFHEIYTTAEEAGIYFVDVDPQNPSLIWAGTGEGLLVRSTDGGQTWQRAFELKRAVPEAFVRNRGELLVTTFEDGVFLSQDNGDSWQQLDEALDNFKKAERIYDIAQNSLSPSRLYLATGAGLLHSDNFGRSWKTVPLTIPQNDLPVAAVAISPVAPSILFVAAGRNMYISDDAGQTWKVRHLSVRRIVTAIAPHPTNPAFILAGTNK